MVRESSESRQVTESCKGQKCNHRGNDRYIINCIILLTLSYASEMDMKCSTVITNKRSGNKLHMECLQCVRVGHREEWGHEKFGMCGTTEEVDCGEGE